MCGNNNVLWIILILIVLFGCCGNNGFFGCGCDNNNNGCGCGCN